MYQSWQGRDVELYDFVGVSWLRKRTLVPPFTEQAGRRPATGSAKKGLGGPREGLRVVGEVRREGVLLLARIYKPATM